MLNRAAGRKKLFDHDTDYAAFIRVLARTFEETPMRICAFCVMPNHWHLLLWPQEDGELARFMQKLTITHVRRWVEPRRRVGYGSVFRAATSRFPPKMMGTLRPYARYVERNPLRCGLVSNAQDWRWSSARAKGVAANAADTRWPAACSAAAGLGILGEPGRKPAAEEAALRHCLNHSRPFGSATWTLKMESLLDLGPLRNRGRPKRAIKR